jgi:ABC-type phosphate transport system permease subunit
MQPTTNIAKGVLVTILAPVLVFFFWLEVNIGASFTWGEFVGYVSPSHPQILGGVLMAIAAIAGPLSSVAVVWATGRRRMRTIDRLCRLECVGLLIAVPLVCMGVFILAIGSII